MGERGVMKTLEALGAFGAFVVAILVWLHFGPSSPDSSNSASSSPNAPYSSGASQSPSSTPAVGSTLPTLTYPNNGQVVNRSSGFVASGAVPSALYPDTIWILDHGTDYIVDTEATVRAGSWFAADYPLGNSSNILPYNITMVAVLANRECTRQLAALDRTGSGDQTPDLPAGCTQFGHVTVNVAKP